MIDAPDILALLALAAFAAGFVDSIAGGGGLITVPALLLAGIGPVEALATNKLQGVFGAGTAAIRYARAGHVDPRRQLGQALVAFLASACGAILVSRLPSGWLDTAMPAILIAVATYFGLRRGLDDTDRAKRVPGWLVFAAAVPAIAFYDGFFGPGTGSFFMLAFVALSGFGVLKSTAHTKLLNFASNLGGLVFFVAAGSVVWKVGLVMAVAQTAGAVAGSSLAMRNGARLIRPLLVITCIALAVRLLVSG